MASYSWANLKSFCPIDLSDLDKHITEIELVINTQITLDNLEEQKERLIMASGELEILMTRLLTLLYDHKILKTEVDKAIYSFLKDDVSRYLGMIDEKQNQLLEVFDGKNDGRVGIGRTSAFKKVIQVSLYGVVYYSLTFSSVEYVNIKETEEIKKDLDTFLRILFLVLSISMSTVGGLPRAKSGGGILSKGHFSSPTTWRTMFTKEGVDDVKKEYKERYGDNLDFNFEDELYNEEETDEY